MGTASGTKLRDNVKGKLEIAKSRQEAATRYRKSGSGPGGRLLKPGERGSGQPGGGPRRS